MVGKAPFTVVVFAVHIGCDRSAYRHVAGPGSDGQEKTRLHDHSQYSIKAGARSTGGATIGGIEPDVVESRELEHGAAGTLGKVPWTDQGRGQSNWRVGLPPTPWICSSAVGSLTWAVLGSVRPHPVRVVIFMALELGGNSGGQSTHNRHEW